MIEESSGADKPMLWGILPVPTTEELELAWDQFMARREEVANRTGVHPNSPIHRLHWREFTDASPAFFRLIVELSQGVAEKSGDPAASRYYRGGAADFIEVLGIVATNRAFEKLGLDDPDKSK